MSHIGFGNAEPLGVTPAGDGINVAVQSGSAEAIAICLFDDQDREIRRLRLPGRTGSVFHGHVDGVPFGTCYGLRAFGPWAPAQGHRFNPAKLLVDPWATAIDRPFRLHPLLFDRDAPLPDDTAGLVPKGIVGALTPRDLVGALTPRDLVGALAPRDLVGALAPRDSVGGAGPQGAGTPAAPASPAFDWNRQVIYELHVRGFTMTHPDIPPAIRGTFAALGHPASLAHLTHLGVTAVELMPSAAWIDERHLPPLNLTNHWGYNPIAFLAPDPRLAPGGWAEVRAAVDALHAAGLAVILDVVLNHSGESDELGPTLSLRGLDNAGYYRLAPDNPALYANDAGCGNILAMDRPAALRLGMDALRAWASLGGMDGFRLDLAVTLGRRASGFDPDAPFLAAVEQDPLLSRRVMIAEPWDIGPGGYQLGAFPARWGEWNGRYRDTMRRFWRGDGGMAGEFATRLSGSADIFAERHRPLTRSINFITAHDGFAMADLVAYDGKHNQANGEDDHDGTDDNLSWNNGVEGPTDDPAVRANRMRDVRAMLATLLLSRGTPMLSMGDEAARTQGGNNNAYAQDNPTSWFDWTSADPALIEFTAEAIALRWRLAPLFDGQPLRGQPPEGATLPDAQWFRSDGRTPSPEDWNHDGTHPVIAALSAGNIRAMLVFHAGREPVEVVLPAPRPAFQWHRLLDTAAGQTVPASGHPPAAPPDATSVETHVVPARSVSVFAEEPARIVSRPPANPPPASRPTGSRPTGVPDETLDRLADMAGIDGIWWDVGGGFHKVGADTKQALLAAMRLPAATPGDCRDSLARLAAEQQGRLPPVLTMRQDEPIRLLLNQPRPVWVTLLREDGTLERFRAAEGPILLPPQPLGRHRILREDLPDSVCHLTVAPSSCYLPDEFAAGERRFGIAAHLYTLRRRGDQGIGDFTTLTALAAEAARSGASVLGLNPLHVLFPHDRNRASPYHPSDRRFLDPIYIDVTGFPGGASAAAYPGPVDYPAVWDRKRSVLRAAFASGVLEQTEDTPEALVRLATFETIAGVLGTSDWQAWPDNLRHPTSAGVAAFAAEHRDTVRFHIVLQALADRQLAAAAAAATDSGLSLGFYRDLAVGAAPDGAEAWSNQDTLMLGVSVGAPPDPFSASGQVWCLPPPDPVAMCRDGYARFAELLVANMRHAGALRIDHVMGLQRLFVVPDGATAALGAYVTYPRADLLAQVALQSQRARCMVVGEDLGTVPEGLSAALSERKILSYSVLWFERSGEAIRPPADWRQLATACVSTHDLPTLAGWWNGADIREKHALGLLDDATADLADAGRIHEKTMLIGLLREQELLDRDIDIARPMPDRVAAAVHGFVAATPALLALVQADDLAGDTVAVNLPGTDRERPNWRRRLEADVFALCRTKLAEAILAAMRPRAAAPGAVGGSDGRPG